MGMIKERDLPNGWISKLFTESIEKEVSSNKLKIQKNQFQEDGIYPIIDQSVEFIAGHTDDSSKVYKGDLPIVIFGDHTRIFKYIDFPFALGADGTKILAPKKEYLIPKYFYYFLRGIKIENHGYSRHYKFLKEKRIVIPPLPTQKKIVAILDKAEKLKGWRKEADELTDEFLKNKFLEIFGDPMKNQFGFKLGTIADLTIKTQYGTSKKANDINEGMHILRMNNITYEGKWDFSSLKHIEFDETDNEKYFVNNGELLFNRTNSKELVGKCAVYREKKPMAYAGYLIKIITDSPATSEFIAGHLNSKFGKLYLLNMAKSIVGMANINAQEVQKIPILIPPMEFREKYAIIVEQIELLRGFQIQSNTEINCLFNSLLQKAFKGELK